MTGAGLEYSRRGDGVLLLRLGLIAPLGALLLGDGGGTPLKASLVQLSRTSGADPTRARRGQAHLHEVGDADGYQMVTYAAPIRPTARTPCPSTLQRLFRHLDGNAVAATLSACFRRSAAPATSAPAAQSVAIDGKAQRGRLRFTHEGCPVHALSAFCHDCGVVLAHEPMAAGPDKAEAELSVAPTLLARVTWPGRVLTGDALFCQTAVCQQVLAAGGEYLLLVKENQGTLSRDIQLLFDPSATVAAAPLTDRQVAPTIESGHGRAMEIRELLASTDLTAYLDWPGVHQVFRLKRTWREQGKDQHALHYGITSLSPAEADPVRLLALRRGHWAIENRLHRRKDVSFGEDASLIHVGAGPTVMAVLRDAAVSLLHYAGVRRVAARLRTHSQQPERAVALVLSPLPTGA